MGGGSPLLEALLCVVYVFHMPLFVFVSGLFSKRIERCRSKALGGLLVPLAVLQLLWLVWIALTEGVRSALSVVLYPQFALWYLAALYVWRTLLPDLLRVRHVLAVSLVLFFAGKLVGGLDNLLGLDRAVGFLVFFLLGYRADGGRVKEAVRRVPVPVAALAPCACAALLWWGLATGAFRFETVFYTLTHGRSIWEFSPHVEGFAAYTVALVGAVALSACFLRLVLATRGGALAMVGRDTMPTYAAHGYVVHAACLLLARAGLGALSEPVVVALLLGLSVATTAVLSSPPVRRGYARLMGVIRRCVLLDN